ncbi:hypothetical protein EW146_g8854 [Bondarzewia mesenterica]|uniref:RlpA-like protein double-psi beta-barrel domain-containing protein n=1 Tax=Bondarzewia mesenterica TaxID=1095465 RepID=A0A4S4LCI0_9AGAM|nr:hypothetical protein EW146_g8854 [Bondarzewia mesenterica]
MISLTRFIALAIALSAASVSAAPTRRTNSGQGTSFTPGTGSCGITSSTSDFVVAVPAGTFNDYPGATTDPKSNPICGQQVQATANGKTVTATVTDICQSCGANDIELSPAAFQQLVPNGQSPSSLDITWSVSDSGQMRRQAPDASAAPAPSPSPKSPASKNPGNNKDGTSPSPAAPLPKKNPRDGSVKGVPPPPPASPSPPPPAPKNPRDNKDQAPPPPPPSPTPRPPAHVNARDGKDQAAPPPPPPSPSPKPPMPKNPRQQKDQGATPPPPPASPKPPAPKNARDDKNNNGQSIQRCPAPTPTLPFSQASGAEECEGQQG